METIKKVSVSELKPGMRVAQNIENEFGSILVSPGMLLDENYINKLRKLGVGRVAIFDETNKTEEKVFNNVSEEYQQSIIKMKGLFHSINRGNKLDFKNIKIIVDSLFDIEANQDLITIISQMKDVKEYTYIHSVNVGMLVIIFGKWIKLPHKLLKSVAYSGFLHDIGKTKISNDILNKNGSLTPDEFQQIKKHPIFGYEIVKECVSVTEKMARGVLLHHERKDGSGYPMGLKEKNIPLSARIIGIVDTFDAMTSDRAYQAHRPPFEVLNELKEQAIEKFDIKLINSFIKNISHYYLGERVVLSNNQIGEIVFINPNHPTRPIIKVGDDFIDLYKKDLNIIKFTADPKFGK